MNNLTIQIISFVVGVASSLIASWLLILRERSRFRLRFGSIIRHTVDIKTKLDLDNFEPDYVVTIDRNSGIVGSMLAGRLGLRAVVSIATVNQRQLDGTRKISIEPLSEQVLKLLKGKKILVMICCNDSGTSLSFVVNHLRNLGTESPQEIKTAAIYTSYSPAILPNYYSVVVGRDTRGGMDRIISNLPWMTDGWQQQLGAERAPRRGHR